MRLAIIGASGFVGRHLVEHAIAADIDVVRIDRRPDTSRSRPQRERATQRVVPESASEATLRAALEGVDTAVHLAARVHQTGEHGPDLDATYLHANRDLALRWAVAAASTGVRRFVFVSSVKAVAERSTRPLDETCDARPEDAYGRSKLAAERALGSDPRLATLERVIVRPPLVYGPGVGANFLQLMRLAQLPIPLPLATATAPRTMISVANLADALLACARDPRAAGGTYFVGDPRDVSAAWLIRELRRISGRRAPLFAVPRAVLRAAAKLLGRADAVDRLFQPLQIDSSRIRAAIGWSPPQSTEGALAETWAHFNAAQGRGSRGSGIS